MTEIVQIGNSGVSSAYDVQCRQYVVEWSFLSFEGFGAKVMSDIIVFPTWRDFIASRNWTKHYEFLNICLVGMEKVVSSMTNAILPEVYYSLPSPVGNMALIEIGILNSLLI